MKTLTAACAVFALAVPALVASGGDAQAHDFIEGAGWLNGFLHPLLEPMHALSLLAFGLMTGQQTRRAALTILFALTLIAGILLIVSAAFPIDLVPAILLACAVAAGLLTALARPLPVILPAVVLATGGLCLILDSVPSVISRLDTVLALAGTALAATLALGLAACAISRLTRDWQRIGVRIVGSWTAASALLVLALRLVR